MKPNNSNGGATDKLRCNISGRKSKEWQRLEVVGQPGTAKVKTPKHMKCQISESTAECQQRESDPMPKLQQ